jgi:hypothetical protein
MSNNTDLHFTGSPVTVVGEPKKVNRMYTLMHVVILLDNGPLSVVVRAWAAAFPELLNLREGDVIGISGMLTYCSEEMIAASNSGLTEATWMVSLNYFASIPQLSVSRPTDGLLS